MHTRPQVESGITDGPEETYVNCVEVRVYGLMRSGNHAIINWLQRQYRGGPICFLNNIEHGDRDPFSNFSQRFLSGIPDDLGPDTLRCTPKKLLVYSYEDRRHLQGGGISLLESVFQEAFERKRVEYVGRSRYRYDMCIIRDPFNFFASRMRMHKHRPELAGIKDMDEVAWNWKILAQKAIDDLESEKSGGIVVKYNNWAFDPNYRRDLCQVLGGEFDDSSVSEISHFGGGSSFEPAHKLTLKRLQSQWRKFFEITRYRRLAHYWRRVTAPSVKTSAFQERWKEMAGDAEYRRLFHDSEIVDLSDTLFGEIQGTREFLRTVS